MAYMPKVSQVQRQDFEKAYKGLLNDPKMVQAQHNSSLNLTAKQQLLLTAKNQQLQMAPMQVFNSIIHSNTSSSMLPPNRRVCMQIKNFNEQLEVQRAIKRHKPSQHAIQNNQQHLIEYRDSLKDRELLMGELISEELSKFDDMEKIWN